MNYCIDCGTEIDSRSTKCRKCRCKGTGNPNWKGGNGLRVKGYILVYMPTHPHAASNGYVLEHRLVMEAQIGRYLEANEQVHHINGVRSDNRKENLALFASNSMHMRNHYPLTPDNLLPDTLKTLSEQLGRTPNRRDVTDQFTKACRRCFGSWTDAIRLAGLPTWTETRSQQMRAHPLLLRIGSDNHNAKLTDESVREIRALHASGMKEADIVRRYGLAQGTINAVLHRRTWKHIK
jgi:hypothetical protein